MQFLKTVATSLAAATLVTCLVSSAFAAPGYIARPATLVKVPLKHSTMISYLLGDVMENASQRHEYPVNILRKDPRNPGKIIQQEWSVIMVFQGRQEADAPVGSNLMMIDENIYELGEIDITSVKVKGNTMTIEGSAGHLYTGGDDGCKTSKGAGRTIVIKFAWSEESYGMKPTIVSQKDKIWCH